MAQPLNAERKTSVESVSIFTRKKIYPRGQGVMWASRTVNFAREWYLCNPRRFGVGVSAVLLLLHHSCSFIRHDIDVYIHHAVLLVAAAFPLSILPSPPCLQAKGSTVSTRVVEWRRVQVTVSWGELVKSCSSRACARSSHVRQ